MNISEIKTKLGVQTLGLNQVLTAEGVRTQWFKNWDNENRIAILIHADTLAVVKANPSITSLGLNTQIKQGSQGEYKAVTICMYKETEEVL
jgi:hypothetical protein